ncbi:MAG: N-6 DNA methylase [Planctomycetes bacterium]|nr:N-6 DNA methylase [Planctomycetota bacterium]
MSRRGSRSPFEAIKTEGGLLPHDLLQRIAARDPKLPGLKDADYAILDHERESEVVNRSWTRLLAAWVGFRTALEKESPTATATTATRDRWLLPLFQELSFGRLSKRQAFDLDGRTYPISHEHEATHTAIHLLGARVGLDVKTQAVQGAAKTTPHGLVQDFLNRSDAHDWAIVTNGLVLRILRDSKSITRQAYVEFDLESIFDDQRYSEFRVLWLVCHESRFRREGDVKCLLEHWFECGKAEGVRALRRLRNGVEEAIRVLGGGFLRHPDNVHLRNALGDSGLEPQEYYRQLLRLVYRFIFLFVTEDRNVLLDPTASEVARKRYTRYYATSHLRALATRRRGGPHSDLWTRLKLIMDRLYAGCPELGLPALGSFLWKPNAVGLLGQSALTNEDLLSALRMLIEVSDGVVVMPVAWAQVGADELGSVYESLLERQPRLEREAGGFDLTTTAGHERKSSGSYYTHPSLVDCLLDSTLEPVLDVRCRSSNPEAAILELRVCDPACGSGHFLVAAARRIAHRLAAVRAGDNEPSPHAFSHAMRDVVSRCIFGVDLNPMAVELCKISLWLEAVEPGRPLSFLDGHIRVGNSLIGATPALLTSGIPDAAFAPRGDDDVEVAKQLETLNQEQREGQTHLFKDPISERFNLLAQRAEEVELAKDATLEGIASKARAWERLLASSDYVTALNVSNAWCASFYARKTTELEWLVPTQATLQSLFDPDAEGSAFVAAVERLAKERKFFHWHLAFPQVFSVPMAGESATNSDTGWSGGFDVIIGNPPWEMPETDERLFFAASRPDIASEPSPKKRQALIARLDSSDPQLAARWRDHVRGNDVDRAFLAKSEALPYSGKGRLNLYRSFLELGYRLLAPRGRLGLIVQSTLPTNTYDRPMWSHLLDRKAVVSLFDFENREELFEGVDKRKKFCLLTLSRQAADEFAACCWLTNPSQLADEARRVRLSAEDLLRFSGDSRALPQFRSGRDLRLLASALASAGQLSSTWDYTPKLMFSSSDKAFAPIEKELIEGAHRTLDNRRILTTGEACVPVYEGKMIGVFDHRQADVYLNPKNPTRQAQERPVPELEKVSPDRFAQPQHWLLENVVRTRRFGKDQGDWELVIKDVTGATNSRTTICTIIPLSGLTRSLHSIYLFNRSAADASVLCALLGSFVIDYFARLLLGNDHLGQDVFGRLPVPPPDRIRELAAGTFGRAEAIQERLLELCYTSWDLQAFAQECGYDGPPFRWNSERRSLLQGELTAFAATCYGLSSEDLSYIMDTFEALRSAEIKETGDYRSKRLVLEIHDRMIEALRFGTTYEARLSPPPADPTLACVPNGSSAASDVAGARGR